MNRVRNYGKWLMLPAGFAVLLFFYAQAAWWHWHLLPNGTLVGHTHPFQAEQTGTPFQQHHHNQNQHALLSQFSGGSTTVSESNTVVFSVHYIDFSHPLNALSKKPQKNSQSFPSLRAPPSLMLFYFLISRSF